MMLEYAMQALRSRGYAFNDANILRQVDKVSGDILQDKGFEFEVKKGSHAFNQKNYEEIGDIITDYIYGLLESDKHKMVRKEFPKDQEAKSFVFVNDTFGDSDTLVVFIHGSGVVRAGQWARKLIINNSIDLGSMLPDIEWAKSKGYDVLVMNTNDNLRHNEHIKGCKTPEESACTTWSHFVAEAAHKKIGIIGHSYGGIVALHLAKSFPKDFEQRVFAILFTDSVHSYYAGDKLPHSLAQKSINFVASGEPLGKELGTDRCGIIQKSAGHSIHEWTPSSARPALFHAFDNFLSCN